MSFESSWALPRLDLGSSWAIFAGLQREMVGNHPHARKAQFSNRQENVWTGSVLEFGTSTPYRQFTLD
jgi:hypothetical protein